MVLLLGPRRKEASRFNEGWRREGEGTDRGQKDGRRRRRKVHHERKRKGGGKLFKYNFANYGEREKGKGVEV